MLAKRVIPTLLTRGNQLVKGQAFDSWRSVGVALQAAKVHAMRSVDELIVLDIAATPEGRGPNLKMVEELTKDCFVPVTIGGGVRSIEDVRDLLSAGADKVCIGTAVFEKDLLIQECSTKFGSQAIVVSIDVKNGTAHTHCGKKNATWNPNGAARMCQAQGAGEIVLTSIDRDGKMSGYDLEMIRSVSDAVDIPVLASGGCRDYADMHAALKAGASGVCAGALFAFTEATPRGAVEYLKSKGMEVRV
jgi:imidazole glycerol-phosphate synthase subunit HisF